MQLYIENRIKQNPYNSDILQNTTPIICFGNLFNSTFATLGLNPSNKEFVDNNNNFLSDNNLRFQNCFSLSEHDLTKLTNDKTNLVLDSCISYFKFNPYKRWFNVLEKYVLSKLNVSYYNDTCCHLDIVQWATAEKWGSISKISQTQLIDKDYPFLLRQLENQNINLLLINGKGVFDILSKIEKTYIQKEEEIQINAETCQMTKFYFKIGKKRINCIAWSKNMQSSYGLTNNMKEKIGNRIKNSQN